MARGASARSGSPSSSNFRLPSPLTLPLFLGVAPLTLIAFFLWPILALASFIPIVGLVSLTSLLSCTAFLYFAIPTTCHLLFSQDRLPKKSSWIPFSLPRIPLFTPSLINPFRLTHSILRLLHEAHRASLPSLFFDSISKRILILGGADSSKILKENIVYLHSRDPAKFRSKRLDVYYPDSAAMHLDLDVDRAGPRGGEGSAPVVLLVASPSYRFLSSKSFPSSQIALRLRRLGYCVVVPSLTSFPDATAEEMVWEIRECLRWIGEEIQAFGGDVRRIWVLGAGVGATLANLAIVQSAVVVSRDTEMKKREERAEARRRKEARVEIDSRNGRDSADEEEGAGFVDPFLETKGSDGQRSRYASSNSPIYEGHYFRSTTHRRPTSTTTVPYSDDEEEGQDEGRDDVSISSTATLPFPPGLHACKLFCGPEDEAQGDSDSQPEDFGETISRFGRLRIRGMILVGGAYDTVKQLRREKEFGLSEISALQKVCSTAKAEAELASPCHLLFAASSLLSSATAALLPPRFLIIHGGADRLVPYSQSVLLKNLLVGVGLESERVRLRLYREETGLGSLASLMHQTKYSPLILDEIERMISSDMLEDLEEEEQKSMPARRGAKRQRKRPADPKGR